MKMLARRMLPPSGGVPKETSYILFDSVAKAYAYLDIRLNPIHHWKDEGSTKSGWESWLRNNSYWEACPWPIPDYLQMDDEDL